MTALVVAAVLLLSRVWLCDPTGCSLLGFPVPYYLPECTQIHVHWVGDAAAVNRSKCWLLTQTGLADYNRWGCHPRVGVHSPWSTLLGCGPTNLASLGQVSKESARNAGDLSSIPGSGRFPGEENGLPLQYSCLENPMDREAWWDTVYGVARVRQDKAQWKSESPMWRMDSTHQSSNLPWNTGLAV